MRSTTTDMESQIQTLMGDFFQEQMGENASSITTFLSGNMLTVRAENSLSPAEKKLAGDRKNWSLLQELKNQEFAKVKSLLKDRLEEMAGCNVLNISSMVEPDGIRYEIITFSENVESR